MEFPKQIKDIVYRLLQEPTLDNFREFLRGQTGEHNTIDFKEKWIEQQKLAKEMLAIANSGGGIIIFGVHENEDKSFEFPGIEEIKDKAVVSNEVKNLISSNLKYEVYDFVYDSSEYDKLNNHKYQMMVIENNPQFLPFLAKKDSNDLKMNRIYVRRGTSCEEANQAEIREVINRRVNYEYPNSGKPLELEEHLEQLKKLYDKINPTKSYYRNGFAQSLGETMKAMVNSLKGELVSEKIPLYPEESYEEFIARMIREKKKKIERVLDLK
ncbi:MAG: ATP-binding protein [Lachnospiraceae bacterium]|nr:ATP-binding protein [Lachnospiraceae bacterium]